MSCVTLYGNEDCVFCRRAKQLLTSRAIPFTIVEVATDDAGRERLVALTGRQTFPQVVIDGVVVGGFRELVALARRGELHVAAECGDALAA